MIAEDDIIKLPNFVRMQFDHIRNRYVLLAPERVLFPCPTSVNIIERMEKSDGSCRFGTLIDDLTQAFEAPREVIAKDVDTMLQGLIDQRFLDRTSA